MLTTPVIQGQGGRSSPLVDASERRLYMIVAGGLGPCVFVIFRVGGALGATL
jgi:hypothetical protein